VPPPPPYPPLTDGGGGGVRGVTTPAAMAAAAAPDAPAPSLWTEPERVRCAAGREPPLAALSEPSAPPGSVTRRGPIHAVGRGR